MHLILTTPSGTSLLFDVQLTGAIDVCADGFTVNSIEVWLLDDCAKLTPTGAEPLPGWRTRGVRFWVRPDDLCHNGTPFKHEQLITAAATTRETFLRTALLDDDEESW